MKAHNLIYLCFLCFMALSCENTSFEKDVPNPQLTTRSIPDNFTNYNTYFLTFIIFTNSSTLHQSL